MSQVGIGMVGAGFLADTRARCYARVHGPGARIVALAARDAERARRYAQANGVERVCADFEELLGLEEVTAVDLCVPNRLHRPMAEAAAAAGKHVICTKPLAAYVGQDLEGEASEERVAKRDPRRMLEVASEDARAMVDAAERAGVLLCYGENWVYAPAIVRAREFLGRTRGRALELRGWEAHSGSHSPYSWSWSHAGGGSLVRLASHPIGAILHWKREEGLRAGGEPILPVAVTAEVAELPIEERPYWGRPKPAPERLTVETWAQVVIAFEDGTRGVAHGNDVLLGGMESRLDVLGSTCHLKCGLSPNDMLRAYTPRGLDHEPGYVMEKYDAREGWSTPMPEEDWSSGHQAMCQAFVEAAASGVAPSSDGRLGLDVTRVVYSAYVSAREGRRVELEALE